MGIVLLFALQDGRCCGRDPKLRGGLIAKPGQAILSSQDGENVKNSRRCGASGQRHPERLGNRAKLEVVLVGEGAHGRLSGF